MRLPLLRLLCLLGFSVVGSAGVALAQPTVSRVSAPALGRHSGTLAKADPCVRPPTSVAAGATLVYDTDTLDAFRQNALLSPDSTAFGRVSLRGDTLIYAARDSAGGVRDTVRLRSCIDEAGEDCSERSIVILISRPGRRADTALTVAGGSITEFGFAYPDEEVACASITGTGAYEYADFREFRFAGFVPGDRLRYRAARGSGVDVFEVVTCTAFGTCDTTVVRFTVVGPRATLPFFDDFSYAGPRPDPALWLEDDVFVNDAFGRAAPSYGVATFDGVDGGGRDFGEGYQDVDQLTTAAIDLSAVAGRSIVVKYYLQAGGRGQAPEFEDNFFTQFRSADGTWVTVGQSRGSRTSRADTVFTPVAIPVDSAAFYHADFQVRFLMRANGAGLFDVWNLDYVRVEESLDTGFSFRDIALAARPPSPLEPYTAIPYSQFAGRTDLLRTRLPVAVWNHFPGPNNLSSSEVTVEDANGATLLRAGLLTGQQFNLPPGLSRFDNTIPPGALEPYRTAVTSLTAEQAETLTLTYRLGVDQDQLRLPGILRNDTASQVAHVADEFAYDDGTAELGLANTRAGDRIALRYRSVVEDTLRGVRFAFPNLNVADANRQLINIQVYLGTLDDEPEYEQILVRPFFPATNGDTIQGFTTYRLEDGAGEPIDLIVPPGDFYVGWQLAVDAPRPLEVGLDASADETDEIFTEYGTGWIPIPQVLPRLRGGLMIRPVFSDEAPGNTSGATEAAPMAAVPFGLYPNPTLGHLTLDDPTGAFAGGRYGVYDLVGRAVGGGAFAKTVSLDLAPGAYLMRVTSPDGRVSATRRIVVRAR